MTFSIQKIANPYMAFAISWFICLGLYSLGWSGLFPPLTMGLLVFLSIAILLYAMSGIGFSRIGTARPRLPLRLNYKWLTLVNVGLYALNFLYSGVPLLNGTRQDDFGVPTVIVVATTLNCFTSIFCFYIYLLNKDKKALLCIGACFALFIASFSRGNILMSMITMFFMWINVKMPRLNFKKTAIIVSSALLIMYLFGVAGNIRLNNEIGAADPNFDTSYNSDPILGLGQASDSFKDSFVPDEFFWTYLYATSPLSNLQYNINKNQSTLSVTGVAYLVIDEFLFDTISKRIDTMLGRERRMPDLIVEQLTVPTTLAGSYNYAGWWGMGIFMVLLWIFPFVYAIWVKNNPMGVIGMSTICTIYLFSVFDNMLILTGLSFQILYPLIFNFLDRIRFKNSALNTSTPKTA